MLKEFRDRWIARLYPSDRMQDVILDFLSWLTVPAIAASSIRATWQIWSPYQGVMLLLAVSAVLFAWLYSLYIRASVPGSTPGILFRWGVVFLGLLLGGLL